MRANVQRLYRAAHSVRDRLSRDMWRVITQIDRESQGPAGTREGTAMLQPLDELVTSFAALSASRLSAWSGHIGESLCSPIRWKPELTECNR